MTPKKDFPIDDFFFTLDDTEGMTDEEIRAELAADGIDLAAAQKRLAQAWQDEMMAAKRERLDVAKAAREARRSVDWLPKVKAMQLSFDGLVAEIARLTSQSQVALHHRDLKGVSREVLEAHLADLMALEDEKKGS